ncbi:regulatory protein LuxR [Sphingobium chlorophenolicum L-1]|uniref:Regulatory protein LuxR n=1 Tax=Sphingobium chlorophenolicum L-1 TaxID=690566 RepID=F6F248_SPHCR|nr:helix-turn-helix transcriptional regulator [Sphingobium chlorophenolicum]AEG51614.1 regulatory protein LuxR [Sphingobium chlorophenolicum L-1]
MAVLQISPYAMGLNGVIEAIGEANFGPQLVRFLHDATGAEHVAVFALAGARPCGIDAISLDGTDTARRRSDLYLGKDLWRRDPVMELACQSLADESPHLAYLEVSAITDAQLRSIVYPRMGERSFLYGPSVAGRIGLSIVSSASGNADRANHLLMEMGGLLLAIVGKHVNAADQRRRLLSALTSLSEIEQCVAMAPERFPPRETQVCARILYGVSTLGIALELGVGEETVQTYRKRLYNRLGISSQRELLLWYVATWAKLNDQVHPLASGSMH